MALKRTPRPRRHRTRLPVTHQPRIPQVTWEAGSLTSTSFGVSFSQAMTLNTGGPHIPPSNFSIPGNTLTQTNVITPYSITLTAAAPIHLGTLIIAPDGTDIRGNTGGTVAAGQFTF